MRSKSACLFLTATFFLLGDAYGIAQSPGSAIAVTPDNFPRAESDLYFSGVVRNGGFGKFDHTREPAPLDKQTVIRLNRDTLYSAAVFDLDAGPVTITLPDAGQRFMSLQVIDEDQYTHGVYYGGGQHLLTREEIGTRYVVTGVRTLVDPADPNDLREVHALQDAIRSSRRVLADLKCLTGIRLVKRKCAMRYWCLPRRYPIRGACSVPRIRSTPFGTSLERPQRGVEIPRRKRSI